MKSLVELIEQKPELAHSVFDDMAVALNQVLPDSDTHERYQGVPGIGLALVIARPDHLSYNPYNTDRPEPSFYADNQVDYPDAWDAMKIPDHFKKPNASTNLRRSTFFALAKIAQLQFTGETSSYDPEKEAIEPGRVGFAGGISTEDLLAVSGLWELHDHFVVRSIATELNAVMEELREPKNENAFAEYFDDAFRQIKAMHKGVPAADISHAEVGKLLPLVDKLLFSTL